MSGIVVIESVSGGKLMLGSASLGVLEFKVANGAGLVLSPAVLQGAPGQGLPFGGTTGQVPAKLSALDFHIGWVDPSGGGGATNLSFSRTATTVTVLSDTGTDAVLPAADAANAGVMLAADKVKLDGVAAGATANSSDATLLNRANHTGTQLASTISDFAATVRATVLTGLSLASSAVISATDTVLAALGQLQAQITLRLVASNNLSDLANAATARSNLGLGTLATQNGTFSGTSSGTNTGDETAGGILTKLLTVDGAGSGLDADLLDGNSSAAFALASHIHTASQVTDFSEAVDDRVAALFVAGTNITLTYNDGANTFTIDAAGGGGSGDNITVNGAAVTDADFDDATPAAPATGLNVLWQKDASSPANVSAYVPGLSKDATAFYAETDVGNKGAISAEHFCVLGADYTLASVTTEQQLFNATTNGRLTLEEGTYFFECAFSIASMSATAGNAAFDLLGAGSATLADILYWAAGFDNAINAAVATVGKMSNQAQTSSASIFTTTTQTELQVVLRGTFKITVAGSIVPSITLVTAAAAVVRGGSHFKCHRVGSSTVTNVGQWD